MRVLMIPTEGPLRIEQIDGLEAMQAAVGGMIEAIGLDYGGAPGAATGYLNENGKLENLEVNPRATIYSLIGRGINPTDVIAGPMFICGPPDADGNDTDISDVVLQILAPGLEEL